MRYSKWLMGIAIAGLMSACGSTSGTDSGTGGGAGGGGGTVDAGIQPTGTVVVNFGPIDDTANKVYTQGDLQWKGSMQYDSTTRKLTITPSSWDGPFAPLYDDGPWTAGGHEPIGSTANDHLWNVTVFVTPPATGSATAAYGLIDHSLGDGWIWRSANGSFTVNAGATTAINAPGQVMPAFGTADFKLVLDTHNLLPRTLADAGVGTWDTSKVQVKGSAWGWKLVALADDGTKGDDTSADGKFTYVLSTYAQTADFHTVGQASSGDKPEFIWNLGAGDGVEYRDSASIPGDAGVYGYTRPTKTTATWTPATIQWHLESGGNKNTYIAVP